MESVLSRTSNRIELRVDHSASMSFDASMTAGSVGSEGQAINFPVRTQLGMPLTVAVGDDVAMLLVEDFTFSYPMNTQVV